MRLENIAAFVVLIVLSAVVIAPLFGVQTIDKTQWMFAAATVGAVVGNLVNQSRERIELIKPKDMDVKIQITAQEGQWWKSEKAKKEEE